MRILGFEITRAKAAPTGLAPVNDRSWFSVVSEPFTGAWQRNMEIRRETVLANYAVFACLTLVASDVAKCRLRLVEQDSRGNWGEVESPAFSPVMRRPNRYQNRIQFFEGWILSKLIHGNTYVLLQRDNRNVVVAMYVLDPLRTKVLVAPDGSIYYQISKDNLTGIEEEQITVPASEIMHDRWPVAIHPLIGLPPLQACKIAAQTSENIQTQSQRFFANSSKPGGILVAPGNIDQSNADRIKTVFEQNQMAENYGRVAVLGNALEYKSIFTSPIDSQLVEQLGSAGRIISTVFNVPAYMVGIEQPPYSNSIEALNMQYYSQCLQKLFEAMEELLDEGLGLRNVAGHTYGSEFDLDNLLRMDTATRIRTYSEAIKGGIYMPNEVRHLFDLKDVKGGNEVYLQQQNFSLSALAKRDAKEDPFATGSDAAPKPAAEPADKPPDDEEIAAIKNIARWGARSMLAAA